MKQQLPTQTHLDRPFVAGDDDDGGGCESVGPTTRDSNGGANDVVVGGCIGNIYSSTCTNNNLHPFDIFASHYKSQGKGMNSNTEGPPFTSAQWKELERQAMIYKYMISSIPVPNYLLFPFPLNFDTNSVYNNGRPYSNTKNGDLEPGRCKRTDGKKWRCSRDVAPHHKYCERHLHRGRPRSRKPVEIPITNNNGGHGESNKKTRIEIPKSTTTTTTTTQQFVTNEPLLLFNAKSDLSISTNRDLSLMMETDSRWQYVMEPNTGFSNPPIFHQDYIQNQPLDLLSYPTYPPAFEIEAPIGFIDAWSIDNLNNTSNNGDPKSSLSPNHENLSTSLNLSTAMADENGLDEEMGTSQYNDHSAKDSRWSCPVSWEPFGSGGPLAEALHSGSGVVGCMNLCPPSPHDSISSPSGVIQRTLFSNSDGSVCNSPTVPSEAVFQWLN